MKLLLILFAVCTFVNSDCDFGFGRTNLPNSEVYYVHRFYIPKREKKLIAEIPREFDKAISHVCVTIPGEELAIDTVAVTYASLSQRLTVTLKYPGVHRTWIDVRAEHVNMTRHHVN